MLLGDLRIGPAARAVELGDDRRLVFAPHLVDAVFVAVEREQPAIAADAERIERIEDAVGRECGVRMREAVHAAILGNHDWVPVPDCRGAIRSRPLRRRERAHDTRQQYDRLDVRCARRGVAAGRHRDGLATGPAAAGGRAGAGHGRRQRGGVGAVRQERREEAIPADDPLRRRRRSVAHVHVGDVAWQAPAGRRGGQGDLRSGQAR